MGAEPGVMGGARGYGRREDDVLFKKRNLTFIETKAIRRGSSSLDQEKNKTHFGINSLTDSNNKVGKTAQL